MNQLLKQIKLGADPELFVFDTATNRFVSGIGLIGGTKDNPKPLAKDGFFVQEDNVLVEFNIPPSSTKDEFVQNIKEGVSLIDKAFFDASGRYKTAVKTSHLFTPVDLDNPLAMQFGCDPDRNAWFNGEFNPVPPQPEDGLRTGGGHIHVGYTIDIPESEIDRAAVNRNIIQWMDYYLGVPSILMDTDKMRRRLYGKAGAYRDKQYGVEYRTLSSFWLASDSLISWAYEQTQKAIEKADQALFVDLKQGKQIQKIINSGSEKLAENFVKENNLVLV